MGLDRYRSIDPPAIRSGNMPAVEISARMAASHDSQNPTPNVVNIRL